MGSILGLVVGPWYEWAGVVVSSFAFFATLYLLYLHQLTLSKQSEDLELQRTDLLKRVESDTRAQAERFWAWFSPHNIDQGQGTCIQFHNGSSLFIYEAVAVLRDWRTGAQNNSGDHVDEAIEAPVSYDYAAIALVVPPGDTFRVMPADSFGGMGFRAGIEVSFTDAAGRHWRRSIGGPLQSLETTAVEAYGFSYPMPDGTECLSRDTRFRCKRPFSSIKMKLRGVRHGD